MDIALGSGLSDASPTGEAWVLLHLKALAACDSFSILSPLTLSPHFFFASKMTTLPPVPMTRPKLTSLARQKLPCSPRRIPRSQLIKEKGDIDHYVEVNFKGLSKEEVAAYRNSYKKSICVDMLRDGYHKSFTELFALMEKWDALREAARVRSLLWLQRPLEEQPDKLDHFYYYLTRAEVAERKGYFEDVYNNLYALACYFNNSEDKWVRNHFYERCFQIAQLIKIDGGKKEAEAHGHMGLLFEEDDQLLEAAEHYEAFHQLTQGRVWKDETGRFLNLLACESLLRTYRLLADKMLENKEYKQAISTLLKASEIAKEGNDKRMEGEASYYLGLAYLAAGNYETALTLCSIINTAIIRVKALTLPWAQCGCEETSVPKIDPPVPVGWSSYLRAAQMLAWRKLRSPPPENRWLSSYGHADSPACSQFASWCCGVRHQRPEAR
ncbi:Tetratricopeptide repeat protein 29 [Pteropus alecto]|uniref:Tetratricopeptide repeat protein 29 n=1 Tax=Pteropus alecto TaxID=9402 RepID=L5L3A3_PTEAL|nr:Tetratricopeptide repeat protein 29 [Pteropus alecto]